MIKEFTVEHIKKRRIKCTHCGEQIPIMIKEKEDGTVEIVTRWSSGYN